jgi:glycosyltransferase involved in cell wall biosynthesis
MMRVLWFTWKDPSHPLAGGAEVVSSELARRLVNDGHEVVFVVGGYKDKDGMHLQGRTEPNSARNELPYTIIRLGNRFTVYWHAYRYYKKHLRGWPDIVIEEINTIPFFTKFYAAEKKVLFVHQLAREIWFHQMVFPLSLIGYLLEPAYLWLLRTQKVITVSASTKNDLMHYGFKDGNVSIISEGIKLEPVTDVSAVKKYKELTLLSLGAIRPMKRTLHQIEAFELIKQRLPGCKLKIAGDASGNYGEKVLRKIEQSPFAKDIHYEGRVSDQKRLRLMRQCHLILVTSVKEGWGLIVTEAASQGTPAVVYDIDGLRDSVRHQRTGMIATHNSPESLAEAAVALLRDARAYRLYQRAGLAWSRTITFNQSYLDFKKALKNIN